jgi:hypothetical protein
MTEALSPSDALERWLELRAVDPDMRERVRVRAKELEAAR